MLIDPERALRLVLARARPLGVERVPLRAATGRVLAEAIRADRDIPPADRSAMDGYAVRSADLRRAPARLALVGEVAAGSPARPRVRPGTCARVLTGANLPPGADAVAMVEQTAERGGLVVFRRTVRAGENVRRRGEDARRGQVLLPAGTALRPMHAGICAAVGRAAIRAGRRPRVALLATGAELRPAGAAAPGAHQVRDSNVPALAAALAARGFPVVRAGAAPDDLAELAARLRRALAGCDALLLTGGASVGRYDFVRAAAERAGAAVRFHGVAMKPGRPLLCATLGRRLIFGLPGNPLSAMVTFHEFALPALRRMAGTPAADCRPAELLPLAAALSSRGGLVRFLPARVVGGRRGPEIELVRSSGSADLVSAGLAGGAVVVPPGARRLPAGAAVEYHPWDALP